MYEEIGKDFHEKVDQTPSRRAPLWGKAIKSLLSEKSDTPEPRPVKWLALKTEVNEKNLHNIISGRVRDPAGEKLVKIADAFGISMPEFMARAMAEDLGNLYICGFADRKFIDYPQHGFSIHSLTPKARCQRDFFCGKMIIKPFKDLRKWQFTTNSTVFIEVESGTLEFIYGNHKRTVHANETLYFDAGVPHKIKNTDSIEARLLIITSPSLL